jgi:hypothetical protein
VKFDRRRIWGKGMQVGHLRHFEENALALNSGKREKMNL